jgi:hypothetical protein
MSTKLTLSTLLGVFLVVLCSCGDDSPINGGRHSIEQLPSQIGMLWKYEVYDSLAETTDTVWVSVTDEVHQTITGSSVFVWGINWKTQYRIEWRTVILNGDTVVINADTVQTDADPLERFVFPLQPGKEWTGPFEIDTSRVTEVGTIQVPAGTFTGAARVERVWNRDFEGGCNWSATWIAPNVGVVSRHLIDSANPGDGNFIVTMNQTWQLYDYDLSTFSLGQFPNSVGSEWVYQLVDTLIDLVDTVTVRVVGKFQSQFFDSVMVWAYEGREYTDTVFVGISGPTVSVFFDTLAVMPFVAWPYEFPMAVGRHWGIYTFSEIPQVDDKGSVRTSAGNFRSAFHYRASGLWLNDFWSVDDWLVPGVGVVKRRFSRWVLGPVAAQEWTLLSYHPPD